jgi:hypothetical protein
LVLRQRPDARIRKAVLFAIGCKPLPVIDGQPAVAAYPESAVVARQNRHRNIAKQAVFSRKHVHNAALQMNQAISIRTDPESPIAVGVETAWKDVGNRSVLHHVAANSIHSGSRNNPHITLGVLVRSKGSRCGRRKRTQPWQGLPPPPKDAFVSGIPHGSVAVLEDVKDVAFRHAQAGCDIRMWNNFMTVPLNDFAFVYDKQVTI